MDNMDIFQLTGAVLVLATALYAAWVIWAAAPNPADSVISQGTVLRVRTALAVLILYAGTGVLVFWDAWHSP